MARSNTHARSDATNETESKFPDPQVILDATKREKHFTPIEELNKYLADQTPEAQEVYLKRYMPSSQHQFSKTLGTLWTRRTKEDAFHDLQGHLYKWTTLPNDASCSSGEVTLFPSFQLLLKADKKEQYFNWLHVKNSRYEPGRLGLFASRKFEKGAFIGVYTGPVLFQDRKQNLEVGDAVVLQTTGTQVLYDEKARGTFVNPKTSASCLSAPSRLYMGCHFANTAHWTDDDYYSTDGNKYLTANRRNANADLDPYGYLVAQKEIEVGDEIINGKFIDADEAEDSDSPQENKKRKAVD